MIESPGITLAQQPAQVRVVLDTQRRLILYAPSVAGDDLIGYRRQGDEASRVTIPMHSVRYVEVQQADTGHTAKKAFWIAVPVAVLVLGAIAVMSRGGGGFGTGRL